MGVGGGVESYLHLCATGVEVLNEDSVGDHLPREGPSSESVGGECLLRDWPVSGPEAHLERDGVHLFTLLRMMYYLIMKVETCQSNKQYTLWDCHSSFYWVTDTFQPTKDHRCVGFSQLTKDS